MEELLPHLNKMNKWQTQNFIFSSGENDVGPTKEDHSEDEHEIAIHVILFRRGYKKSIPSTLALTLYHS
jgi:hypothetical protein